MNILSRRPTIHNFYFYFLVLWSICWDSELVGFYWMWAKIITIKRTKDLNYSSLCALNGFNTRVAQFELNYWNKWTFPWHSNLNEWMNWDAPVNVEYSSKWWWKPKHLCVKIAFVWLKSKEMLIYYYTDQRSKPTRDVTRGSTARWWRPCPKSYDKTCFFL